MKQLALSAAIAAVLTSSLAHASDPLDDVVVTATRTAQTADETLAPVTVITREDIERTASIDVLDALETFVPSLQITRNGGYGKTSGIYLRGADSKNVLVLVDGQRLGSATMGSTALDQVPADMIERIEVVRGPRGAYYGSEAVGGVIHIFTRKSKDDGLHARLGLGNHGTRIASAGGSLGNQATRLSVEAGHTHTHGIDALPGTQPDRDGFEQTSGKLAINHQLTRDTQVGASIYRADGRVDYDSNEFTAAPTDRYWAKTIQQAAQAFLDTRLLSVWNTSLRIGQTQDSYDSTHNPITSFDRDLFKTSRDQVAWQNDIQLGKRTLLTAGVDWLNDRVSSTKNYAQDSRANTGIFAGLQAGFGAVDLHTALRLDDNESYGKHTTGHIEAAYTLTQGIKLLASYGESFRAPSFNDLYYPASPYASPNPDLHPETSKTTEVGVKGQQGKFSWETRAFRTKASDKIVWTEIRPWFYSPINLNAVTIKGIEVGGRIQLGSAHIGLSYTHLNHEDQDGKPLVSVADNMLKLDASTRLGAWLLSASAHWQDQVNTGARDIDGFTRLNLGADYSIDKRWTAGVHLDNALNSSYQTIANYAMPGRTMLFTLAYRQ